MTLTHYERKYEKETGEKSRYGGKGGYCTMEFVLWLVKKYELEKAKFDAISKLIATQKKKRKEREKNAPPPYTLRHIYAEDYIPPNY
jgi:hypothetical protein